MKKNLVVVILALVVLTLATYWGVWTNGFVIFDDDRFVTNNPFLQAGLPIAGVKWAFTTFYQANWHPLTWLSYMVDKGLYGLNPMGFHLTNLLFHMANTLLLLIVLRWMTARPGSPQAGSLWRSAFVVGLFAVHPLHVESVAWVAERKDVLSTFFWLLTMWAYISYAGKPGAARYALVVGLFVLGLMAKPMLVTLPFVLLLLDYWPLKRDKPWPSLVLEKAPLLALSVCSSIITCMAQSQGQALNTLGRVPLDQRLSNAVVSYASYLLKTIWPAKLAVFYPLVKPPAWQALGALLMLIALSYLVIRAKRPYLTVGWLWFLGTMVPVIGLVQVGAQSMADRYTYVPLIGLFIAVAWLMPDLVVETKRWGEKPRNALAAVACLVILGLAVGTWFQVRYWRNDIALFGHAIKVTKNNYIAYANLGAALAAEEDYQQAVEYLTKAIAIRSDMPHYHLCLGNVYFTLGKYAEATQSYARGLSANPDLEDAQKSLQLGIDTSLVHYNFGMALQNQGKFDEAIGEYRAAIRLKPNLGPAHNNLAVVLYSAGNYDEAWSEVQLAEKNGTAVNPEFLQALLEKMPDPGE
ncbi:MAG TPA: tetratricopeptide repeat protein [Armatimonadota bacterium]|nr:tetratricopeptide repeat protein [Armatimonadota bacterium]